MIGICGLHDRHVFKAKNVWEGQTGTRRNKSRIRSSNIKYIQVLLPLLPPRVSLSKSKLLKCLYLNSTESYSYLTILNQWCPTHQAKYQIKCLQIKSSLSGSSSDAAHLSDWTVVNFFVLHRGPLGAPALPAGSFWSKRLAWQEQLCGSILNKFSSVWAS